MTKPSVFIGSSVEGLDVAFALQENLDHDADVTVWNQGVFDPSSYALEGVMKALDGSDFGIFVFTPDDIVKIREETQRAVRDNVVFELGAFIGRLGRQRCFIVMPKGGDKLRLPSDLIGLTPLRYSADRDDDNLLAALGPAANQVRRMVKSMGEAPVDEPEPEHVESLDDADIVSILESWLGSRDYQLNTQVMRYSDVDAELSLPAGSAEKHIETAAKRWDYVVKRKGSNTILFAERESPSMGSVWAI